MKAKSVLLEPWYDFRLELPQASVGRAMTDLQRMGAECQPPEIEGEYTIIKGSAPVAAMRDYPQEITAYTRGMGRFSCSLKGYAPCVEQDKIVEAIGYRAEADVENTPDSVFCAHGAGYNVKWSDVPKHMHLPSVLEPEKKPEEKPMRDLAAEYRAMIASDKELMAIFERTYGPIKRDETHAMRTKTPSVTYGYKSRPVPTGPEYVLADGYNIIFAWDELKAIAKDSLEAARTQLIHILRNYQGFRQCKVIIVFDAYKVKGNPGSIERYGDLSVVYTKEAEIADVYIERVSNELSKNHRVRVATSDGLEQVIILGHGALRVSASTFQEEVKRVEKAIREYLVER